jgi:hypothetical protein
LEVPGDDGGFGGSYGGMLMPRQRTSNLGSAWEPNLALERRRIGRDAEQSGCYRYSSQGE